MFEQNYQNPMMMGQPTMAGYNYTGMQQPMAKFNNPLSPDQIQQLQKKDTQFSLALTEEEVLRATCNHRNAEGTADTLVFDPITGEATCQICGYKFRPIEANVSIEEIKEDTARLIDILQTIKLMYIDLPAEAAKDYMPVIALLNKVPALFEFAAKNMTKHESYNWQYNNRNMGAVNMFTNLQNIFGNGMMPNPAMGGQFMQQPQAQPQQYGMSNGFGYPGAGAPVPNPVMNYGVGGYAPQTTGFQYQPPVASVPSVPTAAPEAPSQAADTTVTQTVNA